MQQDTSIKTILIDLIQPRMTKEQSLERLQELEELVKTYGGMVVVKTYQRRFSPHPRTFIGPGKIEQLKQDGELLRAKLVVINDQLKPRQMYVLSEMLRQEGIVVWDRIDLILKIFAKHAKTTEARLEIELASFRHMGPRIYGMGMELSRQGGGIGTSGIGETNTEIMKRHLKEKERFLEKKLDAYRENRERQQDRRRRQSLQTVAIVGYTNAGKSTLLNMLTGKGAYAADKLFATLDTRVGSLYLPTKQKTALVSDTIGFIQNLPPELLNAFASTLSETIGADVLLHVIDASDRHALRHVEVVQDILKRIHADQTKRIFVLNKIDLAKKKTVSALKTVLSEQGTVLCVSALTGAGLPELVGEIEGVL